MKKVYIGKIVNTHGIKGEIKILSDFEFKDEAFKVGNPLIIEDNIYEINSYRKHKNFDMITFNGINNINDVLFLKGKNVFIDRLIFKDRFLMDDYLNLEVLCDEKILGIVIDYQNGINPLLKVLYNNRFYYIPINKEYILKVTDKVIVSNKVKELIL